MQSLIFSKTNVLTPIDIYDILKVSLDKRKFVHQNIKFGEPPGEDSKLKYFSIINYGQ